MPRPVLALAAVSAAVLLAGCGSPPRHSPSKTRSCLTDAGARTAPPAGDLVATTASEGAFRVLLRSGNAVTLSFGSDADESAQTVQGYERFHAQNVGLGDVLYSDKNVVMLWKEHPSDADAQLVTGCLK